MQVFEKALFNTKYNQVRHEVELYLDASDGSSDSELLKYPINPNAVVNLTVEDSLADWVVRGTLTFFYYPDSNSSSISKTTGQNSDSITGLLNTNALNFYNFRNDGLDRLRIRIVPILDDSNTKQTLAIAPISLSDKKHWTLSQLFTIYDIEDIGAPPGAQNAASATIKCLKLYFWDEWYQKMITNVMEYSTAKSNTNQKIKTGKAMKEIIEKALTYPSGFPLDTTDGAPINTSEWENGSSDIFYTAPSQATAFESLMYVYDKHTSESFLASSSGGGPRGGSAINKAYDCSLLIKERGPNENDVGRFTLKPISFYFEKAGKNSNTPGEYQIEHFFLQGYDKKEQNIKGYRAPLTNTKSDTVDLKSPRHSIITEYRFVDISPLMNSESFVTRPVYSFDFKNRKFNIEFQNNSVNVARELISKKYIDQLYKNSRGSPEKLFLATLNDDKKENRNVRPVFSVYGDEEDSGLRQYAGLKKLLQTGVFQNACIHFRTLGLTSREPGRFIGIDKTSGVDSSDFADKFYGQWFIINIRHVFEAEVYYNDITAIKVHRFDKQASNFPNTF